MELLLPILFILTGFALIVAEVYLVPGFNVVGVLGFLLILFAIGFVFVDAGLTGGALTLLATAAAGGGLFYYLWQSGAWNRFILATSLRHDDEAVAREHEHRARYLGKVGTAVTPLRPTGVVEIDGERIEVVTEGEFIAAGSRVRVVAMDRRRYFARLAAGALPEAESQPD
ncbi:MAG: NfeD family protein [Rhodothermales bacterium]|nr:NfeD family protein [Rhodothermales bacterium]